MPSSAPTARADLRSLLLFGLVLGAYAAGLSLLEGADAWSRWIRLLAPNLWLIGASALSLRWHPLQRIGWRGGTRRWFFVALGGLALAAVLLFGLLGPVQRASPTDAGTIIHWSILILLVPAAEELFFRGVLLDHLTLTLGPLLAALISSCAFGLLHLRTGLLLPMTALSLVLCAVTLASNQLGWAAGLHGCWNAAAVLRVAPASQRWIPLTVAGAAVTLLTLWSIGARESKTAG